MNLLVKETFLLKPWQISMYKSPDLASIVNGIGFLHPGRYTNTDLNLTNQLGDCGYHLVLKSWFSDTGLHSWASRNANMSLITPKKTLNITEPQKYPNLVVNNVWDKLLKNLLVHCRFKQFEHLPVQTGRKKAAGSKIPRIPLDETLKASFWAIP